MFELEYEPLVINEKLKPWEISVVPWDTETFGFGVSVLNPCYEGDYSGESVALEKALKIYSGVRQVEVITASVPSEYNRVSILLQRAGFCFIDLSLSIRYENLNDITIQSSAELSLVPAVPEEMDVLVEMAGHAFQHGRYHQDPLFSRSLADQRYRDWLGRCAFPGNPQRVLTVKIDGIICGFSVVEIKGSEGYMHLHAIDSKWQGRKIGGGMILQSIKYLNDLGAKCVGTKILASNLKSCNMHSRLNGRFTAVEQLLHWHC